MEMREGSVSLGECVGEAVTAMRFGRAERRRELGMTSFVRKGIQRWWATPLEMARNAERVDIIDMLEQVLEFSAVEKNEASKVVVGLDGGPVDGVGV